MWRRERQCKTCPRSHVFSIWITVSAAVEQGSIPAHSMVTMECTPPAPETACDKVESKELVREKKEDGVQQANAVKINKNSSILPLPVRIKHHWLKHAVPSSVVSSKPHCTTSSHAPATKVALVT